MSNVGTSCLTITTMSLSAGAISEFLQRGVLPPPDRSVFKVLGVKKLSPLKHRVAVTDSVQKYNQGLIVLQEGDEDK